MLYFDTKAVFRQKRISKTSKQAWKAVILSCLLPVIYVLLIKHFYILHYAINDDINMKSIVSGAFTGIPDAHMIYTKYPLGIVLKLLYQISAGVDWYGMYLMGIHLLGLAILTFRACSMGRTRIESIVLVAGVYLVYSVCVYSELIAIQYTTTGAFLAGVAVFWLVTGGKCKTKAGTVSEILVAIIMLLLVYCIRLDVFLVAFAMSCIVYVGIYWVDEKNLSSFWRESLIFAVCLGVCILIQAVGYRTEDWKTFLHFNEVREELYDYEQFPEYEENREWYESFGIDENDYLALCSSNIAISGIEDIKIYDSLLEKYHASGSRADRKTELAEAVTVFKSQFTDERLVPFHVIILLLSGLTFFFSRKEKKKMIGLLLATLGLHLAMLFYLCFRGRVPYRAIFTPYVVTLLCQIGLFLKTWTTQKDKKRTGQVVLAVLLLYLAILSVQNYKEYRRIVKEQTPVLEAAQHFRNYFKEHPDNFYFIDTHTFSPFTGAVKLSEDTVYQNYVRLGDWVSYSPLLAEKMEKENFSSMEEALLQPDVYVVTTSVNDLPYLKDHYAETYENFQYSIVDVMTYDEYHLYVYKYSNDSEGIKVLDSSVIERVEGHVNPTSSAGAIDGDRQTSWTSGEPQKTGMVFDIVLRDIERINGLRLDVFRYEDRPRQLRIFASSDNENWGELQAVTKNSIEFFFEPVDIQYIRLILGEVDEPIWNWSISEIGLFKGSNEHSIG